MKALITLLALATGLPAQETLTLEQALERARTRAPLILAAKARVDEARGRLTGASLLFQRNPEIDVAAGRRRVSRRTDFEVGISQTFELGGKRSARIAGANAGVDSALAEEQNTLRLLLADVARAYVRAAAAHQRALVFRAAEQTATDFERSMQRRLDLGDVPVLDVNLARSAAARTRAETRSAEAEREAALGDLRILLGMQASEPLATVTNLSWKLDFSDQEEIAKALDRPDLKVLAAELREAEAQIRLGRAMNSPDLTAGARFEREDGDNVPKAAVSFTIPLFNRGQEDVAVGSARTSRLRQQVEANRRAVEVELQAALNEYRKRRDAAEDLQKNSIALLSENERLSVRSYEEGELNLLELLAVRKDSLESQSLFIQKQLEAALAAIEVQSRSGAYR